MWESQQVGVGVGDGSRAIRGEEHMERAESGNEWLDDAGREPDRWKRGPSVHLKMVMDGDHTVIRPRCEDKTSRSWWQGVRSAPLTMTFLTKEMLEMVPSRTRKGNG